jgi:hypothetical protein
MWIEYCTTFGILVVIYLCLRVGLRDFFWLIKHHKADQEASALGTPIDASLLSRRLENVKGNYGAELRSLSPFKTVALIEERRKKIARFSFFQKVDSAELPEKPHGATLMMV